MSAISPLKAGAITPAIDGEDTISSVSRNNIDLESQDKQLPAETITSPTCVGDTEDDGLEDNSNVPRLSLPRLFWFFFYNFGLFAWGGPVAQIALIKEELVIKNRWISVARFQRVFAVYQVLPGPEAAELCMFFGCLSAGRAGGVAAGVGFILPGFLLMLLASYLYSLAGFENKYFNASFRAVQPIVAGMVRAPSQPIAHYQRPADEFQILRATHKIADHSVVDRGTRQLNPYLVLAALCTALNGALRINMSVLSFLHVSYGSCSPDETCIVLSPSGSTGLFMPLSHAAGGPPPSSSLFSNMSGTHSTSSFVAFLRLSLSLSE